jgi:hypothetical protein
MTDFFSWGTAQQSKRHSKISFLYNKLYDKRFLCTNDTCIYICTILFVDVIPILFFWSRSFEWRTLWPRQDDARLANARAHGAALGLTAC